MNTMQMKSEVVPTVGSLVAKDYRTAAVFKKYGIDFCCKGNRTVEAACNHDRARTELVEAELLSVGKRGRIGDASDIDFGSWPLDLLADYIEKKHHRYVTAQIPMLLDYLDKLCKVHGGKHAELFKIRDLFADCANKLSAHMIKEEKVLFPFIRGMVVAHNRESGVPASPFGSVRNPVKTMMQEHEVEGGRFREIARLSNNYTAPDDACGTYRVAYALLQEFEEDLHLHIHLENNILFPKVVEQEGRMVGM